MVKRVQLPRYDMQGRRSFLKLGSRGMALASLPVLTSCTQLEDALFQRTSGNASGVPSSTLARRSPDRLKIGLVAPLSGIIAIEGEAQCKGFELAIRHLNGEGDGGMLNTMQPISLRRNGVMGQAVEFVTVDNESDLGVTNFAIRDLATDDQISMIVGGSSSQVSTIISSISAQSGIVHMTAMAHDNDLTDKFKTPFLYRQNINAYIAGVALAEGMARDLGQDRAAYYLADSLLWVQDAADSMQSASEQRGWRTIKAKQTSIETVSYSEYFEDFINSGADVLVLAYYGAKLIEVLRQAKAYGISDLQLNGRAVELGIPIFTSVIAQETAEDCAGVYGVLNWHWSLENAGSVAFTQSYEAEYGQKPTEAAHTVYVQTLQYADAVERAASFQPCDVSTSLEGHSFTGTGNGSSEYRASDNQCVKDILVVKGRGLPSTHSDLFDIRHTIPKAVTELPSPEAYVWGEKRSCSVV